MLALFSIVAGQEFALTLTLNTTAFIGTVDPPGDNFATANFFDTGGFDLAVSIPGVTLTRLDASVVPAVPAPSTLAMFLFARLALVGYGIVRARRTEATHYSPEIQAVGARRR